MSDDTPTASPADAAQRRDDVVLVDVREHDEWDAGHAPGALHIPLHDLRPESIPAGAAVMCVCRSGNRSGTATRVLRAAGIDAVNVSGGMRSWSAAGFPVVRDDGQPGTVI